MTYPRIFSLSTVGVLRHYRQDYLIHHARTDFTGSNGVGKSVIADLLQIIFVPDYKLIKFGTDGLNHSLRQPERLPHNVREAYAFLNIEVEEGAFITVGTCIPNNKGRPITPFLILKDADQNKRLGELAYTKEQLPLHSYFIKNEMLLSLQDLAKRLRDEHHLYLSFYETKEKKNELFSFLYRKEILPINLSIEDNLKAFAKVIQSFSKAKTLDVDNSKSLKAFLFEDEASYDKTFRTHRNDLQKLLRDYQDLEAYIDNLEQKQKHLTELEDKEEKMKRAQEQLLVAEVNFAFQSTQVAEGKSEQAGRRLEEYREERGFLERRKDKLDRLVNLSEKRLKAYQEGVTALVQYSYEYEKLEEVQSKISRFVEAQAPNIDELAGHKVDLDQLDDREILRRIAEFKPVYEQYGSLQTIENMYREQTELIERQKRDLHSKTEHLSSLIELLTEESDKDLLAKVVERKEVLSPNQETALFHLLDVHWQKPAEAQSGSRYVQSLDFLQDENIQYDEHNGGVWLDLGQIKEFALHRDEQQIFDDPERFEQMLKRTVEEFQDQLKTKRTLWEELEKFQQNQDFNLPFLQLDQRLRNSTDLEDLKKTALIIQNLDNKIASLELRRQEHTRVLFNLSREIPFPVRNGDLEQQIAKRKNGLGKMRQRSTKLIKLQGGEEGRAKSLGELIPQLEREVSDNKRNHREKLLSYNEKDLEARKLGVQIELAAQKSITSSDVEASKENFREAQTAYNTEYRLMTKLFSEAADESNPEINEQVDSERYEFSILEKVLLGPKIKHRDNIAEALRESNRKRIDIASNIHTAMLKIFSQTQRGYNDHLNTVRGLNSFFRGHKISNKYFFSIAFSPNPVFDIEWIDELRSKLRSVHQPGGLPFGDSVETFVEDFFKSVSNYKHNVDVYTLLSPKAYFDLQVSLKDEDGKDYPGSTGEAYSAIVLLGIGRLSKVQKAERKGLRFIILEEMANLDKTNFNSFPEIARDFGYQIITMTPEPYGSNSEEGWYLHHLIEHPDFSDINNEPLSYYKTNEHNEDLKTYLAALER